MSSDRRLANWMDVLWGLGLLTLPVTSFRYFPSFLGQATVQPLAFYPLAILILLLLITLLKRKELPLPGQSIPLAAFLLITLCTTMIGSLYAPLELGGTSYWGRAIRSWGTIGVGLAFFFVAYIVSSFQRSFEKPLKWLYAGLVLTILWGGIQAVAVNTSLIDRDLVDTIQLSFSLRPLQIKRVSGFAYEPAWLADSLMILYFSWLVGSIITGYRISRYKWLEPVLAMASFVILIATLSRGGLLNALVTSGIVLAIAGFDQIKKGYAWFISPFKKGDQGSKWLRFGIVLAVLVFLVAGFWFLNNSVYFSTLWSSEGLKGGLVDYLLDNRVGSRLAYNFSGLKVFSFHPWTGVGLGGSGFYMLDFYPDWAISDPSVEIATQLGERFRVFPNPKNMYVRLLAETGLAGFWLFVAFLLSILGRIVYRLKSGDSISKFIGTAGLFAWVAVAMVNFTQDSFAYPFMWVVLGMILGFDQSLQTTEEGKRV
jgi:O-antigen ligase